MKTYFSSGLIILLPVLLTVMLVNFLVNLITHPFLEPTQNLLESWAPFHKPMFSFQHTTWIAFSSKIVILLVLVGLILLTGVVARLFVADLFFRTSDTLLHQLPLVNKIYKTCQDTVHSLFSSSSKKFTQVVLVPFTNEKSLSFGLIADAAVSITGQSDPSWKEMASVFVPGTPNPSIGFTLLYRREQLIFVDMSVEEAMKFIVSCGMVMPEFEITQQHDEDDDIKNPNQSDILSSERQCSQNQADLHKSAGSI